MTTRASQPAVLVYRDRLLAFSETFVLNQARALNRFRPVFVGRQRVPGLDLEDAAVQVAGAAGPLGGLPGLAHFLGRPPRGLLHDLARLQPALIHAHFGRDGVNALPLQARLGLPLVVTFHGWDATQRVDWRAGPLAWDYGRRRLRLAERARTLIAVSDHIHERLLGLGFPAERIRTHRIGVDLARFAPGPAEDRAPVVLGIGRFVEKKGFRYLIEAMAGVQRRLPEAELVLIGSGPLAEEHQRQAARLLRRVRFTGPCTPGQVTDWMRRARVLAVPSVTSASGDTEGLPTVLVEGLAAGLPAVGTRHAGIPEAIRDGESGYLVAERDTGALARRLLDVLGAGSGWEAMSRAARTLAERDFDLSRQTAVLEDIYAAVL